jgi:Zn-finger nucleic acid-binding protein
MNCPRDGRELEQAQLDHVVVHDCPACGGIWFQADELHKTEAKADEWIGWIDVDVFGAAQATGKKTGRRCPVCAEEMTALAYPHSSVNIDVCVADHGTWLDKGEFDKIVKALDDVTNAMSEREYEQAATHQLREIVHGNESHLQELRNFMTIFRLMEMRVGVEHPATADAVNRISASGL